MATKFWTFHTVDREILADDIDDAEGIPTLLWTTRDKARDAAEEAIREDLAYMDEDIEIPIVWVETGEGGLYFRCDDYPHYSCIVVDMTVES